MELSLLGETLMRESSDTTKYYGFWMPRGGDESTFAVHVFDYVGGSFKVYAQTKDSDVADSAASPLGSEQTISATGITRWPASGAKEWVRYVIEPTGASAGHIHFQFLAPQWTPN